MYWQCLHRHDGLTECVHPGLIVKHHTANPVHDRGSGGWVGGVLGGGWGGVLTRKHSRVSDPSVFVSDGTVVVSDPAIFVSGSSTVV